MIPSGIAGQVNHGDEISAGLLQGNAGEAIIVWVLVEVAVNLCPVGELPGLW